MGLLTSDREKNGFLTKCITKYSSVISLFSFISGLISFALFIKEGQIDATYFSDNALLPGLANRDYKHEKYASEMLKNLTIESKNTFNDKIPYEYICEQFRSIGIEVYKQKFTLNYPFDHKKKYNGENIYAIIRAPRSASTEAIVLSTSYRNNDNIYGSNLPSISLMFSLAKFFSRQNYWAKDIILLISDLELVGIQAWLNSYHGVDKDKFSVIDYEDLEQRSGAIQAAINLDLHSDSIITLDMKIEGLNGQLPNLDLFNIAVELATREGITPTFHGRSHAYSTDEYETWIEYAKTIGSMMISQGISLPTGSHGLFQKFAIQSITLEGFRKGSKYSDEPGAGFHQIGRLLEGIFRCLNNLLEKFNRSYWFYLLPSTRRYFSIGYYMIPFGLILLPLLFKALNIYIDINKDDDDDDEEDEHSSNENKKQKKIKKKLKKASKKEIGIFLTAFKLPFYCYILGLLIVTLPFLIEKFSMYQIHYKIESIDLIYYTLVTFSIIALTNPLIKSTFNRSNIYENINYYYEMKTNQFIALLNLALLFGALSLLNISLAFGLTLIYCPIVCIISCKSSSFIYTFLSRILLILLHPLTIGYLCILSMSIWYDNNLEMKTHLSRALDGHKKSLLFYIEDWYIYGNWMYFFGCVFLFPAWLQFWSIV